MTLLFASIAGCNGKDINPPTTVKSTEIEPTITIPKTTVQKTAPSQSTYLFIESDPQGARVAVGVKSVGGVQKEGTGRIIGYTPVTAEILPSDVSYEGQGDAFANLNVYLTKQGYYQFIKIIDLGENGHLEKGRIQRKNKLNQIGS